MIIVMGTVRIAPEGIAAARPEMARMVAASNAEDGCLLYAYSQDLVDPGLVRISEHWRDREALKAHFATPHMAEWRKVIPALGISDRNLMLYEASEGEPV
jgi:quinol monooxygenase YgiN